MSKQSSMKKFITPQEYKDADEETRYYYSPDYHEYRTKKERDYSECECCGDRKFIGWVEVKIPIGKPYRYSKQRPVFPFQLFKSWEKATLSRLKNYSFPVKDPGGDKITIPRKGKK